MRSVLTTNKIIVLELFDEILSKLFSHTLEPHFYIKEIYKVHPSLHGNKLPEEIEDEERNTRRNNKLKAEKLSNYKRPPPIPFKNRKKMINSDSEDKISIKSTKIKFKEILNDTHYKNINNKKSSHKFEDSFENEIDQQNKNEIIDKKESNEKEEESVHSDSTPKL